MKNIKMKKNIEEMTYNEFTAVQWFTMACQYMFLSLGFIALIVSRYNGGMIWIATTLFVLSLAALGRYLDNKRRFCNDMNLPKVIGWTRYSSDYAEWKEDGDNDGGARLAVINEIRKNGYLFSGDYHHYGEFGCPVMEDGTIYCVSMRSWGDIMATAWGGDYIDYAWAFSVNDDKCVYPTKSANVRMKTSEEIEKEKSEMEKAQKEFEKYRSEYQEKKRIEEENNRKSVKLFVSSLKRKYTGNSTELIKYLNDNMFDIMTRCKDTANGDNFKWVLFETERKRVEKEREKNRKKWIAEFRKEYNVEDKKED